GILQVQIGFSGAMTQTVTRQITPASDSVVFDTTVVIPDGTSGPVAITAIARNTLDVAGLDGPVRVTVVSGTAGDTIRPQVNLVASSTDRLELKDSIQITVSG